jgi:hypothetical protein
LRFIGLEADGAEARERIAEVIDLTGHGALCLARFPPTSTAGFNLCNGQYEERLVFRARSVILDQLKIRD